MKRLYFAFAALFAAVGLWKLAGVLTNTGIKYEMSTKGKQSDEKTNR